MAKTEPIQKDQASLLDEAAVCTIISKNYLAQARVLQQSLQKHHPGLRLFVLLVDTVDGFFDSDAEGFTVITAEELPNLKDPQPFFFKYSILELNTAVKPFFLQYLFDTYHVTKLIYFDPDIVVGSPLDRIWDLLETNVAVVTPHITKTIDDDKKPGEIEFLRVGTFNLGFIGLRSGSSTTEFLLWWQKRLYDHCLVDNALGLFTDQKWINLAPCLFPGFFVLSDPEYNIAYWNLNARGADVRLEGDALVYGDGPVGFFHFSGYNPEKPKLISKHQDRISFRDMPHLRPIFDYYRELLFAQGYQEVKKWPYKYAKFDNGVRIPDQARIMYRELKRQAAEYGNPFSTEGNKSFYHYLRGPTGSERFWWHVYQTRIDVQRSFPEPFGRDKPMFYQWLRRSALREHDIDAGLLPLDAVQAPDPQPQPQPAATPADVPVPVTPLRPDLRTRVRYQAYSAKLQLINRLQNNPKMLAQLIRLNRRLRGRRPPNPVDPPAAEPVIDTTHPFGVNVVGYLAGEFGIGEAARGFVHALKAAEVPVALKNIVVANKRYEDTTFTEFTEENPYRVNLLTVNADMVLPTQQALGRGFFQGRYNIGLWYWELSEFPESYQPCFEPFQEIWVTSGFCAEAIGKAAPIPVVKITAPILIDDSLVRPSRARFRVPEGAFAFVFSFDYHSFIERKNPFAIVEAFRRAMSGRKDALLVIKSINSAMYPEKVSRLKDAAEGLNVLFIDEYLDRSGTLSLFATCDCLVSLHRSEGLGLGMAEAMYLGKPVIATGYSGNMDFMTVNNSFPVQYRLVELTEDHGPYEEGNVWADPDVDHAAEQMRIVYQDRDVACRRARRAAEDIRTHMNPSVTGREIRDRLRRIVAE